MRYRWLLLLALTALPACGPTLVGGGNNDKLQGAFEVCKWETVGYSLIPDLGITDYIMRNRCMREFGWAPAPEQLMGWRWVGRP
jgi:hypothetical protein